MGTNTTNGVSAVSSPAAAPGRSPKRRVKASCSGASSTARQIDQASAPQNGVNTCHSA